MSAVLVNSDVVAASDQPCPAAAPTMLRTRETPCPLIGAGAFILGYLQKGWFPWIAS